MLPFNLGIGGSRVDVGDIGHSVRQRRAASASWSRTPANNNSRTVWTYSEWIKRGELGTDQLLLDAGADGNNESAIWLTTANKLDIYNYVAASYVCRRVTTAVLRDPTAFFNLVVASNGTTSFKIWINGVEITAFDTTAGTNGTNWFFNHSSYAMHMGKRFNNTNYFDGERARGCFIGGSALTAADFGYFNTEINEWVSKSQSAIKALVDAGDSNSSMLEFDDATSLTTLGYDKSSKGNNWTLNNVSLTAGSTYDWMLDVPGNSYATWSNLNSVTYATKSNGNITLTGGGAVGTGAQVDMASIAIPSGLAYWEVLITGTVTTNDPNAGIANVGTMTPSESSGNMLGGGVAGYGMVFGGVHNGKSFHNSALSSAYTTFAQNDVVQYALDMVSGKLFVGKNGTWLNSGSPTGGTGEIFSGLSGSFAPAASCTVAGSILTLCCGQAPLHASATYHTAAGGYFRYTPPTGFKALCQANLPDPAILNPELHHNVVLATGANIKTTSEAVYPSNFLEWIKDRANANNHQLIDTVRGSSAVLQSNTTAAETTYTAPSGNSVGWAWKAGGAAVTNNAGSVSSQVSANTTAGFSIVTATLTATNQTIGHGVGAVPKFIVGFKRNGTSSHPCYHSGLSSAANVVYLDTTAAQAASATTWNSTAPTSTVFSVGTGLTGDWVFYCFAEIPGYSKIGSYTGNGSADGPYVECGFKPKYVLIKAVTAGDSNSDWVIYDTVRSPYNAADDRLWANWNYAETTTTVYDLDILSSGFKPRNGSANYGFNTSGVTYIFIAFADVPAKYSLAR